MVILHVKSGPMLVGGVGDCHDSLLNGNSKDGQGLAEKKVGKKRIIMLVGF